MEIIIYTTLFVIMVLTMFISAKKIVKSSNKNLWYFILIIAFSLNEGLRWGRGLDYNYYYYSYYNIINGDVSGFEPLYIFLVKIFGYLNLGWQHFVFMKSFMLIFSFIIFMKIFPVKILPYSIILFSFYSYTAENLMRWYLGFSFVLISIYFLYNNKNKLYFLFSLLGISVHFALIVTLPLFFVLTKCKKVLIKPSISISLFLVFYFFFKSDYMINFVSFFNAMTSLNVRFSHYSENALFWITSGYNGEGADIGLSYIFFYSVFLIIGYRIKEGMDHKFIYLYNLFTIAYILFPICRKIELLNRINDLYIFVGVLMFAYILTYREILLKNKNFILSVFIWLSFANFIRAELFIKLNQDKNHTLYIWDANGRETLSVQDYYF